MVEYLGGGNMHEWKIERLEREKAIKALPASLNKHLPEMKKLLETANSHWGYEDAIYRFYHHSFKVYGLQDLTEEIVKVLYKADPRDSRKRFDEYFQQIIAEGTGKEFNIKCNAAWTYHTRPILEAFFHAKFFLEMAIKYAEKYEGEETPQILDSGLAALLTLYCIR